MSPYASQIDERVLCPLTRSPYAVYRRPVQLPAWDGSDPNGKSILLAAEQGLGDTLHFVRFAQILRERGAKTLVYGQASLMALLQNCKNLGPFYPNNLSLSQSFHY